MLIALLALQVVDVRPYAQVQHPPIDEMSGIVASRRYSGTFWVHNDSGDQPRFFAIKRDGTAVFPGYQNRREDAGVEAQPPTVFQGFGVDGASNSDWEDIAYDGENLYLADVGNNGNARRDLGIFKVAEPNPEASGRVRSLAWYPVAYPDQTEFPPAGSKPFDCEAVFWLRGKLYLVTKHRTATGGADIGANLYRMDSWHLDKPNVLKKLDSATDLGGWTTAADVSPDGKLLAALVQAPKQSIWLFDARAKGDKFLSAPLKRFEFRGGIQCEAITFDGNEQLIFSNEQRALFKVSLSEFRDVAR